MTKVHLHKIKRPVENKPKRLVWQLRWHGTDGKRYGEIIGEVGRMTKREAEYLCRNRQGKIDSGVILPDRPQRIGLSVFLEYVRESMAVDVRPRTLEEMRIAADHAIAALGKDFPVGKLNAAAVGRIKRHLADRKLAPATITKTIRKLQTMFNLGIELKLVTSNPFATTKTPKVQPTPIRTYQPQEIDAMTAVAPNLWWETLIRLGYTSGLRLGEMLNLTWADVDLDGGTVSVQAKRAGTFRVGDRVYPVLDGESKTY